MAIQTIIGVPRNNPITRTCEARGVHYLRQGEPCYTSLGATAGTQDKTVTTNGDLSVDPPPCEILPQSGEHGTVIDFAIPALTGNVSAAFICVSGSYDGSCRLTQDFTPPPFGYLNAPLAISVSNPCCLCDFSIPTAPAVYFHQPGSAAIPVDSPQNTTLSGSAPSDYTIRAYGPFSSVSDDNPYAWSGSLESAIGALSAGGTLSMNANFITGWAEEAATLGGFGGWGYQIPQPNRCTLTETITIEAATLMIAATDGGGPPPPPPPSGQFGPRVVTARFENVLAAAWFSGVTDPLHTTQKTLFIATSTTALTNFGAKAWQQYSYGGIDFRSDLGLFFLPNGHLCITFDVFDSADSVLVNNIIVNKHFGAGPKSNWSDPVPMLSTQGSRIDHAGRAQQSAWKLRIT